MSSRATWFRAGWIALALVLVVALPSFAQASPWETSVMMLRTSFTGPIARGLGLIAIVVGGLAFAFGEHGAKQLLAGILFGVGMAISAVNFMAWLFP
jgi:type IV secretion system protein VirB2